MFEKLINKLKLLARERNTFDPTLIDDPVAAQTEWSPAKGGGANFKTHKLVQADYNRLEFRASVGAVIFYLIFLLAGLAIVIGFSVTKLLSDKEPFEWGILIPLAVGSVFAIVGGAMLYYGTAPIVFDKTHNTFWKGRKAPHEVFDKSTIKYVTELDNIHALQIISEYCRSDKSSYTSYELNLVLHDASRINVIDHGNKTKLLDDADTLAVFLGVPIWDAS